MSKIFLVRVSYYEPYTDPCEEYNSVRIFSTRELAEAYMESQYKLSKKRDYSGFRCDFEEGTLDDFEFSWSTIVE